MLTVERLQTVYYQGSSTLHALREFSVRVEGGSALALVGESGSGKSTAALSIMGLIRPPIGRIVGGAVTVDGEAFTAADASRARQILRTRIGFVPQDPSTALDPLFTVRSQIKETLDEVGSGETDERIVELLDSLGVVDARQRLKAYPHEFSGGMRQRVAIAISLAKRPSVLIADEPTTALDVTTQVGILRLLDDLRSREKLAMVFVTHDLAVARLVCQQIAVMYAGIIAEAGAMTAVLASPRHPYTRALLDARPANVVARSRLRTIPGQPPTLRNLPKGCPFTDRCPNAVAICSAEMPPETVDGTRRFRCWNPVTS